MARASRRSSLPALGAAARRRALPALAVLALAPLGCDDEEAPPAPAPTQERERLGPPPRLHCPGAAGCEGGSDGTLLAGAAKVDVTPTWFEKVKLDYLNEGDCQNGQERCGELIDPLAFKDCGTDKLCRGDDGYVGPDADGTEGDDVLDYFRDCGKDDLCPGDAGYAAPDEGEGNGVFDGHWIAGFSTNRPMLGTHDPIWARAFAVQSGDVTVAWVVVDAVGFFWNNLDNPPDDQETIAQFPEQATRPGIRQRVKALAPDLAVDYVMAGSTHTHEAPDTMGQWGFADEYRAGGVPTRRGVNDAWLFDTVIEGAAQAVVEAVRGLKPAHAYVGGARTGFDGVVRDSRDPPVFDDTVRVLRLADASTDETIATVLNWGSHPEVLWSSNNLVTSDYVHYAREAIEGGLPAAGEKPARPGQGGVAVFVMAPIGGLITPGNKHPLKARDGGTVDTNSFERAQANGETIAEAAFEALATATRIEDPFVEFGAERVEFPIDNTIFKVAAIQYDLFARPYYHFDPRLPDSETNKAWIRSEVAILRLGRATFVTAPGELFPELAVGFGEGALGGRPWADDDPNPPDPALIPELSPPPYLAELAGGGDPDTTFVAALTLDQIGYIVPRYDFEVGDVPYLYEPEGDHYEETNSTGPEAQDIVFRAQKAVARWTPPLVAPPAAE